MQVTIRFDPLVTKAIEDISRFTEVYVVGGIVRDWFLTGKLSGHDIDLAHNGDVDGLQAHLESLGYRIVEKGKSFGVVQITLSDGQLVDIAHFRAETYSPDSRKPSVRNVQTIEEDLSRRDFTINAIALLYLRTNQYGMVFEVIDPFGGRQDLKLGLVRAVGNPDDRFNEDGLRMMRAARFAAKSHPTHGTFHIEEKTLDAIRRNLV